jgi:hypothetical protein
MLLLQVLLLDIVHCLFRQPGHPKIAVLVVACLLLLDIGAYHVQARRSACDWRRACSMPAWGCLSYPTTSCYSYKCGEMPLLSRVRCLCWHVSALPAKARTALPWHGIRRTVGWLGSCHATAHGLEMGWSGGVALEMRNVMRMARVSGGVHVQ